VASDVESSRKDRLTSSSSESRKVLGILMTVITITSDE
jgi:hypothetical protein